MCLRYALKMYKNKRNDVAYRYLLLAPVYYQDILSEEQYQILLSMKDLHESALEVAIGEFERRFVMERKNSYDPPEGYLLLGKDGKVINKNV